jgi:glycosyltransferase involved in cell wall biosynthesis
VTSDVTVVIPTRDRPESLALAVESVLRQTYPHLSMVVVDDGSVPPADGPWRSDKRVRLVRHSSSLGPATARNRGAAATMSPFVAFLDDDDEWLDEKIATCLRWFERYPEAGVVVHLSARWNAAKGGAGTAEVLDDPVHHFLISQSPHVDTVVVRRDLHDRVPFDETFEAGADLDYMLRLAAEAPVVAVDEVLARHAPPERWPSFIPLERRIAGRLRFHTKHRRLFTRRREAFHLVRLGHLYRTNGQGARAARSFLGAVVIAPEDRRAWKGFLALARQRGVAGRR